MPAIVQPESDWVRDGDAAMRRGEWAVARDAYRAALELNESAYALEGLGRATWWLEDLDTSFPARQRAFQLYREQGDDLGAGRIALSLSIDYIDLLEEPSVGSGWLQRSKSLLEGLELSAEHGWFQIYQVFIKIEMEGDYAAGLAAAREAYAIGERLNIFDLKMLGSAAEGYARLRVGEVAEGLKLMDEATAAAISGEIGDLTAVGITCCALMYSCGAIADYERAFHWSVRARELCRRWGLRSFFTICRVHYASVFLQRGDWAMAEDELVDLLQRPEFARAPTIEDATMKLAELRMRQGRTDEAEALYARAPHKPLAIIGQARIALDRDGDAVATADLVDRFLRRIGDEDRAERAFALELLARARLRLGEFEAAAQCLREIEAIAVLTGTISLRATAQLAAARLAEAGAELETARRCFEDAIDLYSQAGSPFEAAIARRDLARVLVQLGRTGSARREAHAAFEALRNLGARREGDHALQLLRSLEDGGGSGAGGVNAGGLSRREIEVLALIAQGRGNPEIAAELVLSVRTVERHISSIYEKLNLSGPSARSAATAYAFANGIGKAAGNDLEVRRSKTPQRLR